MGAYVTQVSLSGRSSLIMGLRFLSCTLSPPCAHVPAVADVTWTVAQIDDGQKTDRFGGVGTTNSPTRSNVDTRAPAPKGETGTT